MSPPMERSWDGGAIGRRRIRGARREQSGRGASWRSDVSRARRRVRGAGMPTGRPIGTGPATSLARQFGGAVAQATPPGVHRDADEPSPSPVTGRSTALEVGDGDVGDSGTVGTVELASGRARRLKSPRPGRSSWSTSRRSTPHRSGKAWVWSRACLETSQRSGRGSSWTRRPSRSGQMAPAVTLRAVRWRLSPRLAGSLPAWWLRWRSRRAPVRPPARRSWRRRPGPVARPV